MRQWAICTILFISFFISNCSLQKEPSDPQSSVITWDDLQIKPKTNGDLCTKMSPKDIDTFANIKQEFPSSGLAVGFFPEDLSTPRQIAHETYWGKSNEPSSFDWLFWYPDGNEKPATLRLFVLLDERQLNNALPESGLYNDINLERGADLSIKVKIPPLETGVHDLIVIGIPYPDNEPDVYGRTIEIYRRITLITEPTPSPFRNISFTSLPAEGSIKHNGPLMALELTVKNNGIDVWNWPDPWLPVKKDTPTHFYALAGHEDVTNLDATSIDVLKESFFSILMLIDYQQIEVAPNQTALYINVDKDTAYTRIPLGIPPLSKGKHYVLVLRIDTPGVPVCILNGDPKGRFLPNSVYGKLVGINVLPTK